MSRTSHAQTPVGLFADSLLARDLPALDRQRRRDTVEFIQRRVDGLPSFTRFGVIMISIVVDVVRRAIGTRRSLDLVTGVSLPLLSEYPRLVRSLGYTYVWETWSDTAVDGSAP